MKYQKAKSIMHQFSVAKEELDRRIENKKREEKWLASLNIAYEKARQARDSQVDEVKDVEGRIANLEDSKAAMIRSFDASIAAAKFELQAAVEAKKVAATTVTSAEMVVSSQEERIREMEQSIKAQQAVVDKWSKELPEAQKTMDDVKTRELLDKAAQEAALKMAKAGALEELKQGQLAGKVPAEANLTEIVERYFDRKRMFR